MFPLQDLCSFVSITMFSFKHVYFSRFRVCQHFSLYIHVLYQVKNGDALASFIPPRTLHSDENGIWYIPTLLQCFTVISTCVPSHRYVTTAEHNRLATSGNVPSRRRLPSKPTKFGKERNHSSQPQPPLRWFWMFRLPRRSRCKRIHLQ